MYIKRIELENCGPIDLLDYQFRFDSEGNPKPLILVGKNGSGKSIFISHLVNTLLLFQQKVYLNSETEEGRVYKLRSPNYIKTGKTYSFAKATFTNNHEIFEWVINANSIQSFEESYNFLPIRRAEWLKMAKQGNSGIFSNKENKKEYDELFKSGCVLYFPPNRFEEPAWLNYDNLSSKLAFTDQKRVSGYYNRALICLAPLKINQNWFYDVVLDKEIYEREFKSKTIEIDGTTQVVDILVQNRGRSTIIYEEIIKLLRIILQQKGGNLRFGIGPRHLRQLAVMKDKNETVIPNIFQLSSGETCILNLFLSILRDFDLSSQNFNTLADVSGIVIIDEIDLHLHTHHQYSILPQLIALFPKIQFIITTHSPLFMLGLEKELGKDGFDLLELPNGEPISTELFSELEEAYKTFVETERFQAHLKNEIDNSHKPSIILEGATDIRYLNKAAILLNKQELLSNLRLLDGNGAGSMNNFYKAHKTLDGKLLHNKTLLIFDCDTNSPDADKGNLYRRTIPLKTENPIPKGIENLFSTTTINKAQQHSSQFIDVHHETKITERGIDRTIPKRWEVNDSEKTNLCEWLCENSDANDFADFQIIFDIIESVFDQP